MKLSNKNNQAAISIKSYDKQLLMVWTALEYMEFQNSS